MKKIKQHNYPKIYFKIYVTENLSEPFLFYIPRRYSPYRKTQARRNTKEQFQILNLLPAVKKM